MLIVVWHDVKMWGEFLITLFESGLSMIEIVLTYFLQTRDLNIFYFICKIRTFLLVWDHGTWGKSLRPLGLNLGLEINFTNPGSILSHMVYTPSQWRPCAISSVQVTPHKLPWKHLQRFGPFPSVIGQLISAMHQHPRSLR